MDKTMGPFGHRPGSSRDEAPKANDQAQGHNMEEDTKANDQDGIALDGTTSTNGQWIYTLDGCPSGLDHLCGATSKSLEFGLQQARLPFLGLFGEDQIEAIPGLLGLWPTMDQIIP